MYENLPHLECRAKSIHGDTVHGYYIKRWGKHYIEQPLKDRETVEVKPETVCRLVGYVPSGGNCVAPVYEGDELDNGDGVPIYASISRIARTEKNSSDDFDKIAAENGWTLKN